MIIVKVMGGLGNQMFQYAYAQSLKEKGHHVKLDLLGFNNKELNMGYQLMNYSINIDAATKEEVNSIKTKCRLKKIIRKVSFRNKCIVKERTLMFNKNYLNLDDNTYIEGYFQNEKYFISIKNIIKQIFIPLNPLSPYGLSIYKEIIQSTNSCSIHIRRGDYLNEDNKNIFGTCDISYYNRAIDIIDSKYCDTMYFIFSNDIQWAKNNLDIKHAIFVDNNKSRIPHEDIYLMSQCKNNIIANSSFSWWGSWLNNNENKTIIAPKNWFIDKKLLSESFDIVPKNYIKL